MSLITCNKRHNICQSGVKRLRPGTGHVRSVATQAESTAGRSEFQVSTGLTRERRRDRTVYEEGYNKTQSSSHPDCCATVYQTSLSAGFVSALKSCMSGKSRSPVFQNLTV